MSHPSRIMEDSSDKISRDYVGPNKEISEGCNININNWPRNCSCNIFAKNVAAFCPCPENLWAANWRLLTYKTTTDWLCHAVKRSHLCTSTMKKSKCGNRIKKMFSLRRKKAPENEMLEPRPVFKETRLLKKGLMLQGIKWHDPPPQRESATCGIEFEGIVSTYITSNTKLMQF